ncbi:MAG: GntR family transcriptional regulator [Betaproteobacteria bacterium RIFCSPLOWO2_12_FULL_65_14]|nr:MAG: GntR family transcriptional regulator [Betaproteobacteria bacterium RIFCSPLOWO2_12_FULL_65_14]
MTAKLQALERHEPLGDRVYATLRGYLRAGRIPHGQPLQEAALAAQLGVSRTPVREALARLASDGLVVAEGRSFTVPSLAMGDIEDIYALRFLLEPEALRLVAASKPDRKALAPLRAGLEGMAAAHEAGDGAAFMEANYRYRDAWTDLVPNKRLVRAIHLYADHVRYLRAFTLDEPAVRAVVLKGLKRLSLALAAGDGDAAAEAMRAHLDKAKQILIDKIRRS